MIYYVVMDILLPITKLDLNDKKLVKSWKFLSILKSQKFK